MMVRNESRVIARAIQSALPFIDSWRVMDTGSDDGTPEIVDRLLGHLPGSLGHSDWVDFGHNRSETIRWAKGAGDWLLLLDADMTVQADPNLREALASFTGDAALVAVDGGIRYRMPYLVRGDLPWYYVGPVHEYLCCDHPYSTEWFDALGIAHHGDGGFRFDKTQRDLKFLYAQLLDDPSNARAHFYLGQTLRDAGDLEAAIEHYVRRVELGGWEEECFYALYQVGLLQDSLGKQEGAETLLKAWEMRPTRAEPLYHRARIDRIAGRHNLAWIFSSLASGIGFPEEDLLFVEPWIYEWGVAFERCDAAWRIGHGELAMELSEVLLARDDLPDEHREHLLLLRRDLQKAGLRTSEAS
jgi:tetratricopeptide (TPR) repeat protein